MAKNLYCNNCGNYGHEYKNCRHPILSYGIILYHVDEDDQNKIVLIERKDSLSYIEFMRGKYSSIYDIKYLKLLFSRFTKIELEKVNINDFDTLWENLWIHTESINQRILREYSKSKEKFNKLKQGYNYRGEFINIEYLVRSVSDIYTNNEWEIPKGRRNKYESNKECAIREFEEETNIKKQEYELYNNIIPLIEEYTGINNVRYKHVYYIGKIKSYCDLKIDMTNRNQYTEIKNIKWLNEAGSHEHIRDYDIEKNKIIDKIFSFLRDHSNHVVMINK